jgi:hypothetical protein
VKKKLIMALALLFGVGIVGISLWKARPALVVDVEGQEISKEVEESTMSAEEDEVVLKDYSLPYPGLLPDHPLYFLKMIRDRLQLWITRDTIKRSELMLHYADKRIAAALALAEKGKSGLAVSTATKAEKYLEQAVGEVSELDESSEDVRNVYKGLVEAADKHKKVLAGIESRVPDEVGQALAGSKETCQKVREQAVGIVGEAVNQNSMQMEKEMEVEGSMESVGMDEESSN